jgi:hypothetical protein
MLFSNLMPDINAQLRKKYPLGIVLVAEVEDSGSETSALLAHFPRLGFRQTSESSSQNPLAQTLPSQEGDPESWSLSSYLTLKQLAIGENDLGENQLYVHQAMFACFNEGM